MPRTEPAVTKQVRDFVVRFAKKVRRENLKFTIWGGELRCRGMCPLTVFVGKPVDEWDWGVDAPFEVLKGAHVTKKVARLIISASDDASSGADPILRAHLIVAAGLVISE